MTDESVLVHHGLYDYDGIVGLVGELGNYACSTEGLPISRLAATAARQLRFLNELRVQEILATPALRSIIKEREKQLGEWPLDHDDTHNSHDWIALVARYLGKTGGYYEPSQFRDSMVKAAAVALAAVEWQDRMTQRGDGVPEDWNDQSVEDLVSVLKMASLGDHSPGIKRLLFTAAVVMEHRVGGQSS